MRVFPSIQAVSQLYTTPSLYRCRDSVLAALELLHGESGYDSSVYEAEALALSISLEKRLGRELLSSPPDCAGVDATSELLEYWRRNEQLPPHLTRYSNFFCSSFCPLNMMDAGPR
jgi:hypothetical protein